MNVNPLGSSAVLVLAAALWFIYLLPTWWRRREYLATERNAVRLQQTLRIMAETAQVPRQVYAETSARSVAAHQRILKKEQHVEHTIARAQEALAARAATRRLAEARPVLKAATRTSVSPARRLRRSRALTSLVLLVAVVVIGFGIPLAAAGTWALMASGSVVALGAFALLGRMAKVARARSALARNRHVTSIALPHRTQMSAAVTADAPARSEWTPVPLPKPLYLSRPAPLLAGSLPEETRQGHLEGKRDRDLRELREAAAQAERTLRVAQNSPNVTPIIRPAPDASVAVPSRFAGMGLVGKLDTSVTDLDAVLRRRRAVG